MYLRTTSIRKGDQVYRYAQLVSSRRRESDGVVVKDVIAHLGQLDEDTLANIRLALQASREHRRVVLGRVDTVHPAKPDQSLNYLDVAVFLELWRRMGLDTILQRLLPRGGASIAPADIVASLVIHRCVDPGSKLAATRWFPTTALPELLDVPTTALENTRLHEVLSRLDANTADLMRQLPSLYLDEGPAFSALFVDITDAWFCGRGPNLAKMGRSKDDLIRRMIGILLVCNQDGYPLRWEVLAGNHAESTAMLEQFRSLQRVSWAKHIPIAVDRALGRTAYLQQLLETGLGFVTALVRPEVPNYVRDLPAFTLTQDELAATPAIQLRILGERAQQAGFTRIDDTLYLRDFGVVEHHSGPSSAKPSVEDAEDPVGAALRAARSIRDAVAAGEALSSPAAGRALGLGKGVVFKYSQLLNLSEPLQLAVLEGQARGIPLSRLIAISELTPEEQYAAFQALVSLSTGAVRRPKAPSQPQPSEQKRPIRLRAVAYFNPELRFNQRENAARKLDRVQHAVKQLNEQLASPRSRRSRDAAAAAADLILRKENLLEVYDVVIADIGSAQAPVHQVKLKVRHQEWARRRSLDGFCVLVTPPDFDISPEQLCRAYRDKAVVEADFRIIKSCVELRPIYHHSDPKVRAHVTLCMLALLLQRAANKLLDSHMTAEAASEYLRNCPLNRYSSNGQSAYLITSPDDTQQKILKALGMTHLADDDSMREAIHPR